MMVKARKDHDKEPVADDAASDMSRLAEASSKLFAEQAAAMAMMTAYGVTVAAQMTGMMLGALRGPSALDVSEEPQPIPSKAVPAVETTTAKVVELRTRTAKAAEAKAAPLVEAVEKPVRKTAKQPVRAKPVPAKAPAPKPAAPVARAAAKTAGPAASGRDDLKKISGIGPRLEQELNDRGIISYADIATLGKAAVKKLDTELGLEGRIARDDWASQAKALSGGKG